MLQMYFNILVLRLESWLYLASMLLALAVLVGGRQRLWLFAGLGGFLLGQLLGATLLPSWSMVAVFGLSVVFGVAAGALALVAERPLLAVASFSGVGFLAFALCGVFGVGSPWNLGAYVVAGGIGAALLFSSFDQALNINPVLTAAGVIAANLGAWIAILKQAGGWSELIVTAVVVVVGLIHLFRTFPVSKAAPVARGVTRRAG
jgi:hypothetical protein